MQPQDSSRTTSRGHSSQSRDARLSEVRGQIDALYNTSNSSGNTNRPTMQPIIGNAPTRQPAPSTSAKAATFSVPNLASKPASHAPVVRHAVGGVQHSQTAYRPGAAQPPTGALHWHISAIPTLTNSHSCFINSSRTAAALISRQPYRAASNKHTSAAAIRQPAPCRCTAPAHRQPKDRLAAISQRLAKLLSAVLRALLLRPSQEGRGAPR